MSCFLLLHGGGHGGWCWRDVARILRADGHDVWTPTLTGYGERSHLQDRAIDFKTLVNDVVNVIEFEGLDHVHIVAHSQAGVIAPRVAEVLPERITQIIWLAGVVLSDGQKLADVVPRPSEFHSVTDQTDGNRIVDVAAWIAEVMPDANPQQRHWVAQNYRHSPPAARIEPGRLARFLQLGLPTAYIAATRDACIPLSLAHRFAQLLPGATTLEVDAGHELMITHPHETAAAVLAAHKNS
ncbi:alpha/beta fold hydrolase [Nocardia africana]|uniref:Alpha/beta fold hydrolase n=1 Tax=Nocardia africana TaxID=134964 RepID=A0ABW6NRR8_9NOCA